MFEERKILAPETKYEEDIFQEEVIFQNLGWHKNFNINLYKI